MLFLPFLAALVKCFGVCTALVVGVFVLNDIIYPITNRASFICEVRLKYMLSAYRTGKVFSSHFVIPPSSLFFLFSVDCKIRGFVLYYISQSKIYDIR